MIDQELVRRIVDAKKRLERLQSREVRRFITDYDWHRGHKDDFFGASIHEQYTAVSNGVGSGGALQSAHGGVYRLTAGAGAGRYHYLWLGNAANGFATLDADLGWAMMVQMSISHTTSISAGFATQDAAENNTIFAGMNTWALAANWCLLTRTGGGAFNIVDTGIVADTNPHWHALEVSTSNVNYLLDGIQIATTTVSVPTAVLTPIVRCYAIAAAARNNDLDFWGTIPRNL